MIIIPLLIAIQVVLVVLCSINQCDYADYLLRSSLKDHNVKAFRREIYPKSIPPFVYKTYWRYRETLAIILLFMVEGIIILKQL